MIIIFQRDKGDSNILNNLLKIFMKDLGRMVKCMEEVNMSGRIHPPIKDTMLKAKNKDGEISNLQVGISMKVNGKMENKMVLDYSLILLENNSKKENGQMVNF